MLEIGKCVRGRAHASTLECGSASSADPPSPQLTLRLTSQLTHFLSLWSLVGNNVLPPRIVASVVASCHKFRFSVMERRNIVAIIRRINVAKVQCAPLAATTVVCSQWTVVGGARAGCFKCLCSRGFRRPMALTLALVRAQVRTDRHTHTSSPRAGSEL